MSQVVGFLPHIWDTWIEFLDPGISPQAIEAIQGVNQWMGALSLPLSLPLAFSPDPNS